MEKVKSQNWGMTPFHKTPDQMIKENENKGQKNKHKTKHNIQNTKWGWNKTADFLLTCAIVVIKFKN